MTWKALVIHESMFGNTETIARAVAAGLATVPNFEVKVVDVQLAEADLAGVDLLVLGGPTHAFGLGPADLPGPRPRQRGRPRIPLRDQACASGSRSSTRVPSSWWPPSTPGSVGPGFRAPPPGRRGDTSAPEGSRPSRHR